MGDDKYSSGRFAHPNVDFKDANALSNKESAYIQPKSIINALSEIQRYYVIESKSSEELPIEYFTLEQMWDFFKVGFKHGILEGLIFISLLPLLQTIYPSFKYYFLGARISQQEQLLFTLSSYMPIIITTLFMLYLSKYYVGVLAKRAIFSLVNGRSATFVLKGVAVYFLLHHIQTLSLRDPSVVYSWIDFTSWLFNIFAKHAVEAEYIYTYYFKFVMPALSDTANEILITMLIFAFFPYITIFYKGYRAKRERLKTKEDFERY